MERPVGVIGGIGPMATAYFLERVIAMTSADTDQDHINMIIYNHCTIPDRTAYILGTEKRHPLVPIIDDAKALEALGCMFIVMPCNTAHYFYEEIQKHVDIPVVNIVQETIGYASRRISNLKTVGIMATDGTLATETYQRAAAQAGLSSVLPDDIHQREVMAMIYQGVKAGVPVAREQFDQVADHLREAGAQSIILGCTELSVLKRDLNIKDDDVLDSIDVLASETVRRSGKPFTTEGIVLEGKNEAKG